MKKLLISAFIISTLSADPYIDYIDKTLILYTDKYNSEFSDYNELVVDTSAGMIAISNIDFNPDHQGFSAGVGIATIHTGYGNGNAYALGVQYGYEDVAVNMKGSYKGDGEFIIGSGVVVGF